MRSLHLWAAATVLATAVAGAPGWAAQANYDRLKEVESQIEDARRQLDGAARRLAGLHSELWQLETTGPRAGRPMLGILLGESGTGRGLKLAGVTPDGGAEQQGLKAGDLVTEVNGVRLDQGGGKPLALLAEAMRSVVAGDTVTMTYVRGDAEPVQVRVETQPRSRYAQRIMEESQPWLETLQGLGDLGDLEALRGLAELEVLAGGEEVKLDGNVLRVPAGLRLENVAGDLAGYFAVDKGVVVLDPTDADAGLKAGDVLLSIDGRAVASADAVLAQLADLEGKVVARVKRGGAERDVDLNVDVLNARQALQVRRGDQRISINRREDAGRVRIEISVDE